MGKKQEARAEQRKRRAKPARTSKQKSSSLKKEKDGLFGFMKGKLEITGDIESPIPGWTGDLANFRKK